MIHFKTKALTKNGKNTKMDQQKQELVEKLRSANNILVTVSANPSVDQLAACIGITLLLNKLKKHATAVFSGNVPSTIEFLKPEETIEKNTDSLRDFIISLDKSKADKLRYKVEDSVVKIFITPYKTSITDADLDFSQGDFNVDVVLCLGVNQQQDLDQAITTHGRILHDAVVASINTHQGGELGTINWTNNLASSLSELVTQVCDELGKELMDGQIATSLLTGIVAETGRFSNEKTSPETMRLSAELMAAGANQQLVATELEITQQPAPVIDEPVEVQDEAPAPAAPNQDGMIEISHPSEDNSNTMPAPESDNHDTYMGMPAADNANDNQLGQAATEKTEDTDETDDSDQDQKSEVSNLPASRMMLQPPSLGGTLTANSTVEQDTNVPDVLTSSQTDNDRPILNRTKLDELSEPAPAADIFGTESKNDGEPQLDLPAPQDKPSETNEHINETAPPPEGVEPGSQSQNQNEPLEVGSSPEFDIHDAAEASTGQPPAGPNEQATSSVISPDFSQTTNGELHVDADGNLQIPAPLPMPEPFNEPFALPTTPPIADTAGAGAASINPNPIVDPLATQTQVTGDNGVDAARDAVMNAINSVPPTGLPVPKADVGAAGYLNVQSLPDATEPADTASAAEQPQLTAPITTVPDLTEAAAALASFNTPEVLPPAPTLPPVVEPLPQAPASNVPPPVPPPLPLDDLSKFIAPTGQLNS